MQQARVRLGLCGRGMGRTLKIGVLCQVFPFASSLEPVPQEEEKLPQRNANPGIKVCSRPTSIL